MDIYPVFKKDIWIYPGMDMDIGYFYCMKYPLKAAGYRIWIYIQFLPEDWIGFNIQKSRYMSYDPGLIDSNSFY